jgi:hypothetical protein
MSDGIKINQNGFDLVGQHYFSPVFNEMVSLSIVNQKVCTNQEPWDPRGLVNRDDFLLELCLRKKAKYFTAHDFMAQYLHKNNDASLIMQNRNEKSRNGAEMETLCSVALTQASHPTLVAF